MHLAENYERIVSDPDFMNSHVNEEVARHAPLEMSAGDSVVVRLADESVVSGVVIEDFGPLAGYPVTISEDEVVRSRRWAVETVEIGVVFVRRRADRARGASPGRCDRVLTGLYAVTSSVCSIDDNVA